MDIRDSTGSDDGRLRHASRLMGWACAGLALLLPIAVILAWILAPTPELLARAGLAATIPVAPWQFWLGGGIATLPALALAAALLSARRVFWAFAAGAYLTRRAVGPLRGFGGWLIGAGLAGLAAPTALSLTLSAQAGPGERALTIVAGSTPVLGLVFGGIVWLIAAVLGRAVAIAEDHAQIV